MERKTKITAEEGKHDLFITREFDIPVELLFIAHTDPAIFEEWMSHEYGKTKILKLDCKKHGSWLFQTADAQGNVMFEAGGTYHDVVPNQKITRTFEMDNSPFDVQLEFLKFEKLTEGTSKLSIHAIYKSGDLRDQMLKLPFAHGLSMAHDRLEETLKKLKQ